MKTVGELLRTAREEQKLTLTDIEEKTKIQKKFLRALEENDFRHLPEAPFVKGFIKNYTQILKKDPKLFLAVFRRDYAQDNRGKVIPRGLTQPLSRSRWQWTPKITLIATLIFTTAIFFAYLVLQFRIFAAPPPLTILEPQENQLVSSQVNIQGTTHPQATISINGKKIPVTAEGKFTQTISLTPGTHSLTIQATSRNGKTRLLQRTIIVE